MVPGLEVKFAQDAQVSGDGQVIEGYASRFGIMDQGGDTVLPGAFTAGLKRLAERGGRVRMLWQHDPANPIGVWEDLREDATGLWVRGRLLPEIARAREAAALIAAGAIEGLSIGYRTIRAEGHGRGRKLAEVDLWEISLVTFPMLPEARVGRKERAQVQEFAALFGQAAEMLRGS